ncbi:DUF2812 domain-containing protein [Oceanobacillus sp. J11TS1]|uniref:DUF2812 domain-containing protein n=1 Tax=Oceanobacillus sp. J11TS1 TaxID=2807191 RepID=UPI001B28E246|nr:DUF2812 domain-containing protein [Oceanobacillus sp. J11TS1]GIO23956.1 hypothetical protein J11TS1_25370 [Oceanobacillus sp. J11TS1]
MKWKFVLNIDRIFFQHTGTEKLERLAREGWIVGKLRCGGFLFQLKKEEPKEVQYQLGFQPIPESNEAIPHPGQGWEVVDAIDCVQVYRAAPDAPPIEMNHEQLMEQIKQEEHLLRKYTLSLFIFLILSFVLHIIVGWALVEMILLGGIIMLLIAFLLFLALYILNRYRQHNLKEL